jgi:hypothetical protein
MVIRKCEKAHKQGKRFIGTAVTRSVPTLQGHSTKQWESPDRDTVNNSVPKTYKRRNEPMGILS